MELFISVLEHGMDMVNMFVWHQEALFVEVLAFLHLQLIGYISSLLNL